MKNIITLMYKDIKNYLFLRKALKSSSNDQIFARYNAQTNIFKTNIGIIVNMPPEFDQMDFVTQKHEILLNITQFNKHLDFTLGLCEILDVDEPIAFYDENDKKTTSYFILYRLRLCGFTVKNICILLFLISIISYGANKFFL